MRLSECPGLECVLCRHLPPLSDLHFGGVFWMELFYASPLSDGQGEEAVSVWEEPGPSPMLSSGRGNGCAILKGEGFR